MYAADNKNDFVLAAVTVVFALLVLLFQVFSVALSIILGVTVLLVYRFMVRYLK